MCKTYLDEGKKLGQEEKMTAKGGESEQGTSEDRSQVKTPLVSLKQKKEKKKTL